MNGKDSLKQRWEVVDAEIRSWWDRDIQSAQEADIRDPAKNAIWFVDDHHRSIEQRISGEGTLLFLPYPYISAGGSEASFPEMYCWDIYFINKALLLHDRGDIVRNHILNHLSMIERFGFVLHGEVLEQRFFGRRLLRLWTDTDVPIMPIIEAIGHIPLPPYIHRPDLELDRDRYQTVFARETGVPAFPAQNADTSRLQEIEKFRSSGGE